MGINLLKIKEVKDFIEENYKIHCYITQLIKDSIKTKKNSFSKERYKKEYDCLKDFHLINRESSEHFLLDYNQLPVCYVLTEIAEATMQEKVPTEPIACLIFANKFAEEIRKPEIRTFWYSDLEIQLESYLLVFLHQIHFVDITAFVDGITEEMKDQIPDVRGVDNTYRYIFSYLSDSEERMSSMIIKMLSNERTIDTAKQCLQSIGKINPAKAVSLYKYFKENGAAKQNDILHNMLNGLFYLDESYYLNEAFNLFNENPIEGLLAITWFNYTSPEQIKTAFDFVTKQTINELAFLQILPTFYIRLIENKNTSDEIKTKCFKYIGEFTKHEDPQLRNNLVWRTGMINGFDKEKYDLLPNFMAWGKPYFLRDYFSHFNSPKYLFELVKDSYLHHGMSVDMDLLKEALHSQFYQNPNEFSKELLSLLSDNIAIIRFAGIQVLMSRHGGLYEVDFLQLDEVHQLRIIETLLPLPTNIEELLPLILTLRKSSYQVVQNTLEEQLKDLIWAYDYNLIKLVEKFIDVTKEKDTQLIESLNASYLIYKKEKDAKSKIKELNPIENELENVDYFFRLEHEKNAELMEQAQSKSFLSMLAKNIHVIRGSGFTSEGNTNISIMGQVGKSWLIDQRYSINPDKYEWHFKMNAIAKNYKSEGEE